MAPLIGPKGIMAVKRGLRKKVDAALRPSKDVQTSTTTTTTTTSTVPPPTSPTRRSSEAIAKEIKELRAEMSAIRIERYTLQ